jgi:hypothetical protein
MISGVEYKLWSSSFIFQFPVTSSLLGPNILLRILFSNTLRLCSFLNVRDQVSYPYKTTGRIMFFFFNLYIPGQQARWQKILNRMVASIPWIQSALNLFMNRDNLKEIVKCTKQKTVHLSKPFVLYVFCVLWPIPSGVVTMVTMGRRKQGSNRERYLFFSLYYAFT